MAGVFCHVHLSYRQPSCNFNIVSHVSRWIERVPTARATPSTESIAKQAQQVRYSYCALGIIVILYIHTIDEVRRPHIFSRGSGPDKSLATVLRITHTYSEVRLLDEQTCKMHQKINQSDESGRFLSISSCRGPNMILPR